MKLHKDIVDYVYIILHRSMTLELINEYNTVLVCKCICLSNNNVCDCHYFLLSGSWGRPFNYRLSKLCTWSNMIYNIHTFKKCNAMLPNNY